MLLYHGSSVVVTEPDVHRKTKYAKDFGDGFYCTEIFNQAARWAVKKGKGTGYVTQFLFDTDKTKNLRVLRFDCVNSDWLDFIAHCRSGGTHNYDIVVGPMADDTIYNYVQEYKDGNITKHEFMMLAKFNHATHQIVFCTEEGKACLKYCGYRQV